MHRTSLFVVLFSVLALSETNAYKFLVVSPLPGKSHAILGDAIVENLANAGHEVTYVTVFVPTKPSPKVTIVDLSDNIKYFPEDGAINLKLIMDGLGQENSLSTFVPMLMNMSRVTIEHPNVQTLLTDKNQQFDAVITEWMFNEVYAGFAGVFNCPLIWFSTVEPHWMILRLVDEIPNTAYTVDILSDSVPPLSFKQRIIELSLLAVGKLIQTFWISGIEHEQYNEFFVPAIKKRHNTAPSFETLRFNTSLVLTNSHLSMGVPARLPANVIPIGGFHIKPGSQPLPENLQKLMDNAKNGVIYFSMGSNLKSKHLPDEVKQDLLKVFGKLKQTIIWKFEENLPNTPSNVHIIQWAPQQSILGHKNCVLFITHGGLLSTTESMHYGIPTIGIPVFADQFVNVARAVKKGYAQKVDLSYRMAADIDVAIKEILNNPEYTIRVKELSKIYHDRPVSPGKLLVHWSEHVVKTGGALHLRSPAFLMPWYQKLYLDLILVLISIFVILKYVFIFLKNVFLPKRKQKLH